MQESNTVIIVETYKSICLTDQAMAFCLQVVHLDLIWFSSKIKDLFQPFSFLVYLHLHHLYHPLPLQLVVHTEYLVPSEVHNRPWPCYLYNNFNESFSTRDKHAEQHIFRNTDNYFSLHPSSPISTKVHSINVFLHVK